MIVCGTGHRPDKLGGYGTDTEAKLITLAQDWLRSNRPTTVISGMAMGWDMALAHAAVNLNIPFVAAIPFKGQELRWRKETIDYYHDLLRHSEEEKIVCEGAYAPWKMQVRNEWMVEMSNLVLALWDGSDGGTANCIKYAEKVGRPVENLWKQYEQH